MLRTPWTILKRVRIMRTEDLRVPFSYILAKGSELVYNLFILYFPCNIELSDKLKGELWKINHKMKVNVAYPTATFS